MPRKKKHLNSGPAPEVSERELVAMTIYEMREKAAEFFEAGVLIFTREEGGETKLVHTKFGNQFAIKGMLETYMDEHISPELHDVNEEPDDLDGDEWTQNA